MDRLNAIWTVRFGLFGSPESLMRGGVVSVEDGRILGGDSVLAYIGYCRVQGTALEGHLTIVRHGDPSMPTIFGTIESDYEIDFVGEEMSPDMFEGRLLRPPHPDGRMVMRRLASLPPLKRP